MGPPDGAQEDERYELRGELGTGSSGTVYRVLDRRTGAEAALKVLHRLGGAELYRFKREFRSLAGLHHPNVALLHELYAVGDDWMYTMELIDGVPFDQWVRPGGALDVTRLRAALGQLADGLTALHRLGKVHRDLKPTNVLCDAEGRVVILDFGLVTDTLAGDRTHEGRAIGTVAYMSPEQAADVPLTPASDWYAVGVMLYEALCGERPFRGGPHEILVNKQVDEPRPPSVRAPGVPPDLDRLCARLLARDPDRRPDGKAVLAVLGLEPSPASAALTVPPAPAAALDALATLHQALADSRDRLVFVVLSGGPGAGKSALLERFVDEAAREHRARTLVARNDGREQSTYPSLDQLVDQLGAVLLALPAQALDELAPIALPIARVFPTLRRIPALAVPAMPGAGDLDAALLRQRALDAFIELLRRLAVDRPLVIGVDGPEQTTAVGAASYARLLGGPTAPCALVVVCQRTEDRGRTLVETERWGGAHAGDLRRIDLDAAAPP